MKPKGVAIALMVVFSACSERPSPDPTGKEGATSEFEEITQLVHSRGALEEAMRKADDVVLETTYGGDAFTIRAGRKDSKELLIKAQSRWKIVEWEELKLNDYNRGVLRVFCYLRNDNQRKIFVSKGYFVDDKAPTLFAEVCREVQESNPVYSRGNP
jgi:hypothetical protein